MRPITFRGRDAHGAWHYGDLVRTPSAMTYIRNPHTGQQWLVARDSIGQNVDLRIPSGDLFEGDTISFSFNAHIFTGVIVYRQTSWQVLYDTSDGQSFVPLSAITSIKLRK